MSPGHWVDPEGPRALGGSSQEPRESPQAFGIPKGGQTEGYSSACFYWTPKCLENGRVSQSRLTLRSQDWGDKTERLCSWRSAAAPGLSLTSSRAPGTPRPGSPGSGGSGGGPKGAPGQPAQLPKLRGGPALPLPAPLCHPVCSSFFSEGGLWWSLILCSVTWKRYWSWLSKAPPAGGGAWGVWPYLFLHVCILLPGRPSQLLPPENPSDVPPSGHVNSYLKLVGHGQVNKPHGLKGTDAERKLTMAPALVVGSSLPTVATRRPDLLLCQTLPQKSPYLVPRKPGPSRRWRRQGMAAGLTQISTVTVQLGHLRMCTSVKSAHPVVRRKNRGS